MQINIPRPRLLTAGILMALLVAVCTSIVARGSVSAAAAQTSPKSYTATRIRARSGAVPRGTTVTAAELHGGRVFANATDGFAIASIKQASYPAVTDNGGKSWKVDGPQLWVAAADAPDVISQIGMHTATTLYAYGPSVIDMSIDGGKSWWHTYFDQYVSAVVPETKGGLVAFVQQTGDPAKTQKYVSSDHGRRWTLTSKLATT